jgi:phosphohistidine phosphatase SixA
MFAVFVRHAEPVATGNDPALSTAGKKRAVTLAKMLADAGIKSIFTSNLRRTKDTAAPLATQLSITPVVIADAFPAAAAQVKSAADRVLVIGHTNTVPEIIEALGGPHVEIEHTEFDRLFVLQLPASGAGSLLGLRYKG